MSDKTEEGFSLEIKLADLRKKTESLRNNIRKFVIKPKANIWHLK
jgi:hypothetical protein